MQVIATGKWSKAEKRWRMVVALRRPVGEAAASPGTKPAPLKGLRRRPRPNH